MSGNRSLPIWRALLYWNSHGLQYSVTAIGTLVLQAAINGLGAAVVAGVTAAQKINAFISCPVESLGQTYGSLHGAEHGSRKA